MSYRGAYIGQALGGSGRFGTGIPGFAAQLARAAAEDQEAEAERLAAEQETQRFELGRADDYRDSMLDFTAGGGRVMPASEYNPNVGLKGFREALRLPDHRGAEQVFLSPVEKPEVPVRFDPTTDIQTQREAYARSQGWRGPQGGGGSPAPRVGMTAPAPGFSFGGGTPTNLTTPRAALGTGPSIDDLPTGTQTILTTAQPALEALERYEEMSSDYMDRAGLRRIAAGVPVVGSTLGDGDMSADIGELEAAQTATLMAMKELAALGVLNGPDLKLVESMVGSPTSLRASLRDPRNTLARIQQARQFLQDKIAGIQSAYGMQAPPSEALGGFGVGGLDYQEPPLSEDNPFR